PSAWAMRWSSSTFTRASSQRPSAWSASVIRAWVSALAPWARGEWNSTTITCCNDFCITASKVASVTSTTYRPTVPPDPPAPDPDGAPGADDERLTSDDRSTAPGRLNGTSAGPCGELMVPSLQNVRGRTQTGWGYGCPRQCRGRWR